MSIVVIEAARDVLRQIDTRRYEAGQKRWQAVLDARAAIGALFVNTPNGVMGLSTKTLLHPEATYLVIDLENGRYGSAAHERVRLTRVGFQETDGVKWAMDLTTGETLGQMNVVATTPYRLWQHDFSYSNNPLREAAYTGIVWGSPSPEDTLARSRWVLPLSGPALRHPAFQRQAEFAFAILANEVMALNILLKIDRENDQLQAEAKEQQAIVAKAVATAAEQFPPAEWDASLVQLIKSMDWTFDYADRPESRFYDHRSRIQNALCALPLEVAVAFIGLAGCEWKYPLQLLRRHPERMALAA